MNLKAEKKARSRSSILESSARLLRARGIVGARVADVMEGAGLTVGGFYAHFASKEALVDETLAETARRMRERLFEGLAEKPAADRAEVVLKRYLSVAHRDEVDGGCPFPSVAGEVGTSAPEHAPALARELDAMAKALEAELPPELGRARRDRALGLAALMIGGLMLARATRGTPLSDELVRACRALGRAALGPTG
jgi:TetR/AcrR family transcriptional repressor of nem operon